MRLSWAAPDAVGIPYYSLNYIVYNKYRRFICLEKFVCR